ncbi:MAG: double-strand break repair protein AddB [Alphaproteobacteria bacterium]|nr:double-strand break repair protein AddB [Alphaproteobacteria bacterium]
MLRRAGRPAVFHIPPELPFVDLLARGLSDDAGADPMALADFKVLLPTRRSIRALREAFLRQSGGRPLLLPNLTPLNDVGDDEELNFATSADADALPPPIDSLRRLVILTRLILAYLKDIEPHRAVGLAAELARLLDQVETEQLKFDRLVDLVPADLAQHWQITVEFLSILTRQWPKILRDEGCIDPADHRNRAFARQIEHWTAHDPGPVVAAGSTGSIPATADLLAAIARLPNGCVVLPGLDVGLDDESWAALDDSHPQAGMKRLLERIGVERHEVLLWPACATERVNLPRRRLASEAMRPAATSHQWLAVQIDAAALDGISRITAPTRREEAAAIALAMRGALEKPDATCALVTPDHDLAERVASELERWDIAIDDSAGKRLDRTPVGVFLGLIADMMVEQFAPAPLLAACKHPLMAAGLDPPDFRRLTRQAELALLRGARPAPGIDGLRKLAAIEDVAPPVADWIERLAAATMAMSHLMEREHVSFAEMLEAHMVCAEHFAATPDRPGPLRLWAGDDGEMAARFAADLARAADALPAIAPNAYPALFMSLLAHRVARPRYGRHPRLAIVGPLEARLQRFDLTILGSLNEGTWPATISADPWMSRPMRRDFGLPAAERLIGLAAHDVAQALCAPNVMLSRALKIDGTPSVPSRWLRRLDQVTAAAGLSQRWAENSRPWTAWASALTRPAEVTACPPPAACPPVSARPRRMSVTRVEEWMRDPYATYARFVLKLQSLDPIDQDPGAADFGNVLHRVLERFVNERPTPIRDGLIAIGREEFAKIGARPGLAAFWWPRFERVASWVAAQETDRRPRISTSHTEIAGQMTVKGPAGSFVLTATADRIDEARDGLTIIDYKTGKPPTAKEVAASYAPQLPLEAAIAAAGGFKNVSKRDVVALEFWQLSGRDVGGEVKSAGGDPAGLSATAVERLERLIAIFDDPATPYRARPNPAHAPRYSDYEHLARVREWASLDGGEE